jgi:hypothetical protein
VVDPDAVPGTVPGAPPPPGGSDVVDWITRSTRPGRTVLSAVPPGYARYATIVVGEDDAAKTRSDAALVDVLDARTAPQPWWLGYLDTGVADVVDPGAPRVSAYHEWPYVLRTGGPAQALGARTHRDSTPWHSALPELLFPADRSWLVSTLWDDDWRCVGGPAALVEALVAHPDLDARLLTPDEDATPPGLRPA